MERMGKYLSIVLVLIIASSSCLIVKSADAQSISKPSAPEFTVRYVDYSYDVPPTYGIDQFTGKETIVKNGYHVENRSFEFTIRNQPYTPYEDSQGNNIHLFYNLRFKGHFGAEWMYFPFLDNGQGVRRFAAGLYQVYDPDLAASNSAFTILLESIPTLFYDLQDYDKMPKIGDEVDFQVQAAIGYVSYAGDGFYSLAGQSSSWSNTQTIKISAVSASVSHSPNPTPTPSVPEFTQVAVISFFVSLPLLALLVKKRFLSKDL